MRIDELLEEGNGECTRPSKVVEPPLEQRCRRCGLPPRKPERDRGASRVGLTIKPRQELLGLIEPALEHPDFSKTGIRVDTTGSLTGLRQLPNRRCKLLLRGIDTAVRGEDIRATGPAERKEDHVVVLPDKVLQN